MKSNNHLINSPPFTFIHHYSLVLLVASIALLEVGCDSEDKRNDAVVDGSCEENPQQDSCLEATLPPAHSPQCLAIDDDLCVISFSWEDMAPRLSALTPDEDFEITSIAIFNAGDREQQISYVESSNLTADLVAPQGHLNINQPQGESWSDGSVELNSANIEQLNTACQTGKILPQQACRFSFTLPLKIKGSAPINAIQRIEIAAETQVGSRFAWALPLLVVDPIEGLELGEVTIEDSTEDDLFQKGDKLRLNTVEVLNHSFAPFEALSLFVSFNSEELTSTDSLENWEALGLRGLFSDEEVVCPAAQLTDDNLVPGRCIFSFSTPLLIPAQFNGDQISLEIQFKDQGIKVGNTQVITRELSEWTPDITILPIELSGDDNRDRLASPGERIMISQLILENQSDASISVRGRVRMNSDLLSATSSSDLSINETQAREDFYENCPGQSSCLLDVNLTIEVDAEAQYDQSIPFSIELVDQSGLMHQVDTELSIVLPDVQLFLADFDVKQDTLDSDLSAGERGVIRYIQILNQGLADATALQVQLSTDSPFIIFEDESELAFGLNTLSSELDERSGDCPSTSIESNGYCYRRTNIAFMIAEDAPLGEVVIFHLEMTDIRGISYQLEHSITLF